MVRLFISFSMISRIVAPPNSFVFHRPKKVLIVCGSAAMLGHGPASEL